MTNTTKDAEPWKPCELRELKCDGEFHRGWDGHDPYICRCPRPKPAGEKLAHQLLGEFCACYGEAWPAITCATEAKKLADWLAERAAPPAGRLEGDGDALSLIAQGWEVIESDGETMTIQAPDDWEGDERERLVSTRDRPALCTALDAGELADLEKAADICRYYATDDEDARHCARIDRIISALKERGDA